MAKRKKNLRPTNAELQILRVLWAHGPGTVAQIQSQLRESEQGYTTILKLLQIMHEKGIVDRDESFRPHIYRPRYSAEETQTGLVRDLVARAFGGSAGKLVVQALSTQKVSEKELVEIRKLLKESRSRKQNR